MADYLQQAKGQLGGKIKSQDLCNVNFKQDSLRVLVVPGYKGFKMRINEHGKLFGIDINVNTSLALAINNPNRVMFYDTPFVPENSHYTIYLSDDDESTPAHVFFTGCYAALHAILLKIGLQANESVFIYANKFCMALRADRDLIPVLDDITGLIAAFPVIFKKEVKQKIEPENIPDNLQPLLPWLKKFAISDDAERQELSEKTGKKKKLELMKAVAPLMPEINRFLDSFKKEPMPEEAMLIGNLAELVSEWQVHGV